MTAVLEHPPTVQPFDFDGTAVRVVTLGGEPWFALADLARVLGIARKPSAIVERLDADGVRQAYPILDSLGRHQPTTLVNEPNMWLVILRSDSPKAEPVRRWVTHDVLPQIRKTGSYGTPALTGPELMAAALIEAQATLARHEATVRELTPRAEAWDALADTAGDYSMRDAAQMLSRDHGIDIGQNRLAKYLREIGWVDSHSIPYQRQVDVGRLRSRARYYTHARTGERVLADPQIRITPKGVEELRRLLTEPPQEAS